jgi:hypothetical protein
MAIAKSDYRITVTVIQQAQRRWPQRLHPQHNVSLAGDSNNNDPERIVVPVHWAQPLGVGSGTAAHVALTSPEPCGSDPVAR